MNFNSISKTLVLIFFTSLCADTYYVPDANSLIQDAIDNASDGDTVLVAQDTYSENLLIEKEIVLKSVDGDTPIINGSNQTLGNEMASTITIRPPNLATSIPVNIEVKGFEIKGGVGNKMDKDIATPSGSQTITERLGGGIMIYNTSPKIDGNFINNNGGLGTSGGGGIMSISSDEDWDFNNRDYAIPNCPPATDSLYFFNNTFENNDSNIASSIYIEGSEGHEGVDLTNSTFDIYSTENQGVSQYWVDSQAPVFYNNVSGNCEPIIEGTVYVDPVNGEDIDGCSGHMEYPFKTIGAALKWVYPTPSNPITIFLNPGTYNNSNEDFPLNVTSNLTIAGSSVEETIIDAGGNSQVFIINNSDNVTISDMTISGGSGDLGGGILIEESDIVLNNLLITDNGAEYLGCGIFMGNSSSEVTNVTISGNNFGTGAFFSWGSTPILEDVIISNHDVCGCGMIIVGNHPPSGPPTLTNVTIQNNYFDKGGGMSILNSDPILNYVSILENTAEEHGGGIFIEQSPIVTMNNVTVAGNSAPEGGGGIFIQTSLVTINNATITGNNAEVGSGILLFNGSSSSIVNSIVWGNGGEQSIYLDDFSEANITFSDAAWEGEGNINQNPLFVNPDANNFSLQSNSPCIDSGSPDFPLDPDGTIADMGAFYFDQSESAELGDLNGDAIINILDLVSLVDVILQQGQYSFLGDVNSDGINNIIDVVIMVGWILGD